MIKGNYPIEIYRFLEDQIRESEKPQPNLEIDNFLIKTFRKTDKMLEAYEKENNDRAEAYRAKMQELEAIRQVTEEMRLKAEKERHQAQTDKPILNPGKVKFMGVMGAAMDLFFSKRKE